MLKTLLRSRAVQASLLAVLAALIASGIWRLGHTALTSLEWKPYDTWVRLRNPVPVSPFILVIRRDPASENRFGAGAWDHALLARVITGLDRAGAASIGLDVPVGDPSPPGRGGAASDAMLIEATKSAGIVVYPLAVSLSSAEAGPTGPGAAAASVLTWPTWPSIKPEQARELLATVPLAERLPVLARHARGLGHTLAIADGDGVVRRLPLYVAIGERAVPAFGLALATSYLKIAPDQVSVQPGQAVILGRLRIPIDEHGQALVSYAGQWEQASISFLDLWNAIEEADTEKLRGWVKGKIVLLLPAAAGVEHRTPLERYMPTGLLQAHLLNTLLTGDWVNEISGLWKWLAALVLSGSAAWFLLSVRGWVGIAAVVALASGYGSLVLLLLPAAGMKLPVFVPMCALLSATGGAILWAHLTASHRLRLVDEKMSRLQQELEAVRHALISQESHVEGLQEDLEAARGAVTRSAGKEQELVRQADALREQLAAAQAQEDATRRRLTELESALRGLQAVSSDSARIADAEQERLRRECEQMAIITREPRVLAVFRDIKKSARSPLPVLILGEPGTGKELFARAVHRLSPRAGGHFIPVNMAAISPELFESELFGHVRGSFTGALGDRKGYFELAHQGTIFLDEIGDLRLEHQGKLLRVLQEKCFYRVGDIKPTAVDVRVVAATNKDLERGISEGWFREDLYFRLKGIVLRLPPLRERREDLAPLAQRFLQEATDRAGRPGLLLSQDALAALEAQEWKGNIRELQHCLELAVALAEGTVITKEDLRLSATERSASPVDQAIWAQDSGSDAAVLACLRRHRFDMQATARTLGWDRSTITQRLKGMGFRALADSAGDRPKAALALAGDSDLVRAVELKLVEYHEHLLKTIREFTSAEEAITACRRRFKNLPDRHFHSLEILVRQYFDRRPAIQHPHSA